MSGWSTLFLVVGAAVTVLAVVRPQPTFRYEIAWLYALLTVASIVAIEGGAA